MSMRSLSLGFSLKHTHMHIHYPLCERVYRSVLGPILLWCLTFSLHQSCETNPLSHTHAVHLKACLQKHPLNSCSILYAVFQQKNLPVIQFIQTLNALKQLSTVCKLSHCQSFQHKHTFLCKSSLLQISTICANSALVAWPIIIVLENRV